MFGFVIFLHVVVCICLAVMILMQSGKGGGLTESFSAAESLFGAKTNIVLVKTTAVLAGIFIVTSLTLAFLSSKGNKSLISQRMMTKEKSASTPSLPADLSKEVKADVKEAVSNSTPQTQPVQANANPEAMPQPKESQASAPEASGNPR